MQRGLDQVWQMVYVTIGIMGSLVVFLAVFATARWWYLRESSWDDQSEAIEELSLLANDDSYDADVPDPESDTLTPDERRALLARLREARRDRYNSSRGVN